MSRLLRATTLIGAPVVTLGGESPLEVKDVVFDRDEGRILGFTLRKHGFLGGPVDEDLTWDDVHGLGPDAVVVADEGALHTSHDVAAAGGDVIGNRVMTISGTDVGEVVEVVIRAGAAGDVVGFEIEAAPDLRRGEAHHVFLPLPDAVAISGAKVIVPDSACRHIRDDLSGFGGAVDAFRAELAEDGHDEEAS